MKALKTEDLLDAWEQGQSRPPVQRVLILLAAAFPEIRPHDLVRMSIGERDSRLLRLREHLFGQHLQNSATCPKCRKPVEWENRTTEFLVDDNKGDADNSNEFELDTDGYQLRFVLPNSLDVAAAIMSDDAETAERILLARCLTKIESSGSPCEVQQLPESVIRTLSQRIESLDPQADIRIDLTCPECSLVWDIRFDIASYLWAEVNDWAQRMLRVVSRLAIAYGWSEREILGLSPLRRQLYLGMLEQ